MVRRKAVYYLSQPDRIGEACDQINWVRNVYPESEYELTLVWPILRPVANEPLMEILCRGIHTKQVRSREELLAVYQGVQQQDPAFVFIDSGDRISRYEDLYPLVFGPSRHFFASLTTEELEKGQRIRARLGIPSDAQLVTLHVREGGYLPNLAYHSYRDSDIKNYYHAIQYLVDKGYWVIRLGDKSMQRLENLPERVIDAPFHPDYEPFFEPYFIACSRFYLGVLSGPHSLADLFRVPRLVTNAPVIPTGPANSHDLFVYKKYFSMQLGRVLTYEELVTSPVLDFAHTHQFKQADIQLLENTPAEILGATWEMDTRLDGSYPHTKEAEHLKSHIDSIEERAHHVRKRFQSNENNQRRPFYISHLQSMNISLEFIHLNPGFLGHIWPTIRWQDAPPTVEGEPESMRGLRNRRIPDAQSHSAGAGAPLHVS